MRAISNKRLRASIAYTFVSLNWPTRNDFPIIALQPFFDWKREKTLSKHIWAHFKSQAKSPRSNRSMLSFTSIFENHLQCIGVARRGPGGNDHSKIFSIIVRFETLRPKKIVLLVQKSNIFPLPNFFAHQKILGWLRHCFIERFTTSLTISRKCDSFLTTINTPVFIQNCCNPP